MAFGEKIKIIKQKWGIGLVLLFMSTCKFFVLLSANAYARGDILG